MTNPEIKRHVTVAYGSDGNRRDGRTGPIEGVVEHRVDELNEGTSKPIILYKMKRGRGRNW